MIPKKKTTVQRYIPGKRYSSESAEINNFFVRLGAVHLASSEQKILFKDVICGSEQKDFIASFHVKINRDIFSIYLDARFLLFLFDFDLSIKSCLKIPKEIKKAAFASFLEKWFVQYSSIRIEEIEVEDFFILGNTSTVNNIALFQVMEKGDCIGRLGLSLNNSVYRRAANISMPLGLVGGQTKIKKRELKIYPRIKISKISIKKNQHNRLNYGDIILIDESSKKEIFIGKNFVGKGVINDGNVVLERCEMSDHRLENDAIEGVVDIDNLDVELVFELGGMALPLNEVERIKNGHIFTLGDDYENNVLVRNCDKVVAKARLVKVNDKLGVQILECSNGSLR